MFQYRRPFLLLSIFVSTMAFAQHLTLPGVVIDHSFADTKQYIGSPSIAVLSNDEYLASHDLFGPGSSRQQTLVFASADKGATWSKRATIEGQWWSSLFVHRGAVYLMGTSREHGFTVIRRSEDGGTTWTTPTDKLSGLLMDDGKYHTAPVPVVVHKGRIWRGMEDEQGHGGWGSHFRAFMMSAPEDADLLNADNWTFSNRLGRNPEWLHGKFGGWLEGNAVVTPDGGIVDMLRADYRVGKEKAAIIKISEDGKEASFNPRRGFVDFPGGCKKFSIRYDDVSKRYWSLANWAPRKHASKNPERVRNTLALVCSKDLRYWNVRCVLLYHPDTARHGFQYADWLIDGDDIIAVVRTAFDDSSGGAHNQHDANYIIFHRFADFRNLAMNDSTYAWRKR